MCTPVKTADRLESRGPSALAPALAALNEAAFRALLTEPPGSGAPQYAEHEVGPARRCEVHGPPRRDAAVARRIDPRAGLDLSELNTCTRSKSMYKLEML